MLDLWLCLLAIGGLGANRDVEALAGSSWVNSGGLDDGGVGRGLLRSVGEVDKLFSGEKGSVSTAAGSVEVSIMLVIPTEERGGCEYVELRRVHV